MGREYPEMDPGVARSKDIWQGRSSKIGLEGPAGVLTATLRILGSDLEAVESQLLFFSRKLRLCLFMGRSMGGRVNGS